MRIETNNIHQDTLRAAFSTVAHLILIGTGDLLQGRRAEPAPLKERSGSGLCGGLEYKSRLILLCWTLRLILDVTSGKAVWLLPKQLGAIEIKGAYRHVNKTMLRCCATALPTFATHDLRAAPVNVRSTGEYDFGHISLSRSC